MDIIVFTIPYIFDRNICIKTYLFLYGFSDQLFYPYLVLGSKVKTMNTNKINKLQLGSPRVPIIVPRYFPHGTLGELYGIEIISEDFPLGSPETSMENSTETPVNTH